VPFPLLLLLLLLLLLAPAARLGVKLAIACVRWFLLHASNQAARGLTTSCDLFAYMPLW
jgi:hypothetical protein